MNLCTSIVGWELNLCFEAVFIIFKCLYYISTHMINLTSPIYVKFIQLNEIFKQGKTQIWRHDVEGQSAGFKDIGCFIHCFLNSFSSKLISKVISKIPSK